MPTAFQMITTFKEPTTKSQRQDQSQCLTLLPAEILIQIYSSLNSFTEVTRLARTCRRLNDICKTRSNADVICKAVGPRCFECFEDADALLLVQHGDNIANLSMRAKGEQLRDNAAVVERSVEFFNGQVCKVWNESYLAVENPHPPYMLPSERLRYIHAYYRCWVLKDSSREANALILRGTELPELMLLWESAYFLMSCSGDSRAPEFGEEDWAGVHLDIIREKFDKAFRDLGLEVPPECPEEHNAPFEKNAFWDHKQWWYQELAAKIAARRAEKSSIGDSGLDSA